LPFVLHYTKGGGSSTKRLITHLKSKHKNYSRTRRDPIAHCEKGNVSF